jgi:hypothetical protein
MEVFGGCYCGEVRYKADGEPKVFRMPQAAVYTSEKQVYHVVPEGVPSFAAQPGAPG